jgi:hypothetical protein
MSEQSGQERPDLEAADRGWPRGRSLRGSLRGLRVQNLSRVLAGPFATMLLADLGASGHMCYRALL